MKNDLENNFEYMIILWDVYIFCVLGTHTDELCFSACFTTKIHDALRDLVPFFTKSTILHGRFSRFVQSKHIKL